MTDDPGFAAMEAVNESGVICLLLKPLMPVSK